MASHDHGDHDHEHDHDKTFQPDEEESLGHYGIAEMAVRELLLERGVFTEDEFRSKLEKLDSITPALGAKVIARAWTDPDFKKRLLENGSEAVKDFGVEMGSVELYVVENTPNVHNVIVCTLCSCYPRPCLAHRPIGTKAAITGPARSVSLVKYCKNLALLYPMILKSACTIAPPTCATWFCPYARRERKIIRKSNSKNWLTGTR